MIRESLQASDASSWHRTKIVCTLGPATDRPGVLEQLVVAGMDVARINASHDDHVTHTRRIQQVRQVARQTRRPVAVLLDLPGPKFRVGNLPDGQRELHRGAKVTLALNAIDQNAIPVMRPEVLRALRPGESIFLVDGTIELQVETVAADSVTCRVLIGGTIRSRSGINLPQSVLPSLVPTDEDRRHISFAVTQNVEWIGVSFVQTAEDLARVRGLLPHEFQPLLMAKIEKRQALANLDAIIEAADGVMVARGDLGVETDLAQIPLVQKRIIAQANAMARPVITATQMLESMVEQKHPTRAEVTDVANAVLDGTDGVMLSAESAIGGFPVMAVQILRQVVSATEAELGARMALDRLQASQVSTSDDPISFAACQLAMRLNAKAIIAPVSDIMAAVRIVRFRPNVPLIAVTDSESLFRQLAAIWGVAPLLVAPTVEFQQRVRLATESLFEGRVAQASEPIVVVSGSGPDVEKVDTLQIFRS